MDFEVRAFGFQSQLMGPPGARDSASLPVPEPVTQPLPLVLLAAPREG